MILPSNLPAKTHRINLKEFAHVKPWRPPEDQVTDEALERAKKRLAHEFAYEEKVARRIAIASSNYRMSRE